MGNKAKIQRSELHGVILKPITAGRHITGRRIAGLRRPRQEASRFKGHWRRGSRTQKDRTRSPRIGCYLPIQLLPVRIKLLRNSYFAGSTISSRNFSESRKAAWSLFDVPPLAWEWLGISRCAFLHSNKTPHLSTDVISSRGKIRRPRSYTPAIIPRAFKFPYIKERIVFLNLGKTDSSETSDNIIVKLHLP